MTTNIEHGFPMKLGISHQILEGIGLVLAHCAVLEITLDAQLHLISKAAPHLVNLKDLNKPAFPDRMNVLKRAAPILYGVTTGRKLARIVDRAVKAQRKRNVVAHGAWFLDPEVGSPRMSYIKLRGKRQNRRIKTNRRTLTQLAKTISKVCMDFELWDLERSGVKVPFHYKQG